MDCHEIRPGIYRVTHKRLWWEGRAKDADEAKRKAKERFNNKERTQDGKESSSERQAS